MYRGRRSFQRHEPALVVAKDVSELVVAKDFNPFDVYAPFFMVDILDDSDTAYFDFRCALSEHFLYGDTIAWLDLAHFIPLSRNLRRVVRNRFRIPAIPISPLYEYIEK